jgi:hypothetical protein
MRSVTPLSYVYILYTIVRLSILSAEGKPFDYTFFNESVLNVLLAVWMVVEAAFFPYYYLVFRRLNKINHDLEVMLCNDIFVILHDLVSMCEVSYSPLRLSFTQTHSYKHILSLSHPIFSLILFYSSPLFSFLLISF